MYWSVYFHDYYKRDGRDAGDQYHDRIKRDQR